MFELFWLALVAAENFDLDLNFNTISLGPGRVKGRQESLEKKFSNLKYKSILFIYYTIDLIYHNNFFQLKKSLKN